MFGLSAAHRYPPYAHPDRIPLIVPHGPTPLWLRWGRRRYPAGPKCPSRSPLHRTGPSCAPSRGRRGRNARRHTTYSALGPCRCAALRGEGDRDAGDAQRQVDDVVDDTVAVGQQPKEHRYDEPEQAHQQVDHPQPTDHVAGEALVALPEAHIGQKTAREQVDDVLYDIYIHEAEQRLLTREQAHHPDQDDHDPHDPGVRPCHLSSSLLWLPLYISFAASPTEASLFFTGPALPPP